MCILIEDQLITWMQNMQVFKVKHNLQNDIHLLTRDQINFNIHRQYPIFQFQTK